MKAIFAAIAMSLFTMTQAFAFDGSKYDPDQDRTHDQAGIGCWTCETHSRRSKVKVLMAETRQQAEEKAVYYCVDADGDREECIRNLKCVFENTHHPGPHEPVQFFDFARGMNGLGYCYLFDGEMNVMNGGRAVASFNCNLSKIKYDFGTTPDGRYGCFEWTPYGHALEGRARDPILCRKGNPNFN